MINSTSSIISTIAGDGMNMSMGDGGPAIFASVFSPVSVAVGGDSLFILEVNKIRVVNMTSGDIDTLAGSGVAGFMGDDGPASEALFNDSMAIDVDGDNNIYIADTGNNRIRIVDSFTGIISTILGPDSVPSALLSYPAGVSVGLTGLYISDTNNNKVGEMLLSAHTEVPTFCPSGTSIRSECAPVVACTTCPAGMYAFGANSAVCSPCLEGTFSEMGSAVCSPCAAGSVSETFAALCDLCEPGYFSSSKSQCSQCAAGSFSAVSGSSTCTPCDSGDIFCQCDTLLPILILSVAYDYPYCRRVLRSRGLLMRVVLSLTGRAVTVSVVII